MNEARPRDGPAAIGLMVAAMAFFTLCDVFIKLSAETVSVAQILLVTGLGATATFAALAAMAGDSPISPLILAPGVVARNLSEALGTFCIVNALAKAPLSLVAAINQAIPLIVTIGAATILGERVGPRRWTAVLLGLVGVLIILRPTAAGMSAGALVAVGSALGLAGHRDRERERRTAAGAGALGPDAPAVRLDQPLADREPEAVARRGALFAVGSAIGLAGRDVFTRRVPAEATTFQLATWGSAVVAFVGGALALGGAPVSVPGLRESATLLGATVSVICAYYAITASVRLAEVSLVSPFRYTRLVFALIMAMTIFRERPDAAELVGAAIVIASGLYIFARESRLARRS